MERRLKFIPFMKPKMAKRPPEDDEWIHEIKYDGYRTQLIIENGNARAYSSSGNDWTSKYRNISEQALTLPCKSAIIDGEIIINDANGISNFGALPRAIKWEQEKLIFMAFDLLHIDGDDIRSKPLTSRKAILHKLLSAPKREILYCEHLVTNGKDFFEACERLNLEGMVSKLSRSRYKSGLSKEWLKIKCFTVDEYNVIGTKITRTKELVAILQSRTTLDYAGVAFVNLKSNERKLFRDAVKLLQTSSPTIECPRDGTAKWLKQGLIATVKHLRGQESLRHASIMSIRVELT